MKNILKTALFIIWSITSVAYSQVQNLVTAPLKVGDKVPDVSLGKVINFKNPTINFSELKGKVIILDFWEPWCGSCIDAMPNMVSLQKKFGDKILILPVASKEKDTPEKAVRAFLLAHNLNLPSVVDDQGLNQMFPHTLLPHEVWIDGNGIVIAITSDEEITENNINKIINKQNIRIVQKSDNIQYDYNKALFIDGNGGNPSDNYLVLSVLKVHDKALAAFESLQLDSNGIKGLSSNISDINDFYSTVTLSPGPVNPKRVLIETENGLRNLPDSFAKIKNYSPWPGVEFRKTYSYSLQLSHSVSDTDFYRNYMLNDLNKFFSYKARIEKKIQPCYVLIKTVERPLNLLSSKGGQSRLYSTTVGPNGEQEHSAHYVEKIQNLPFNTFIKNILEAWWHNPPIINETGLNSEHVDMDLNYLDLSIDALNTPMNIEVIRKILIKYGLDIIEANRMADILILTKK